MLKKDGHTHTEFCPHGNGDDMELMIQKAIRLGFDEYSITEHAPLPKEFSNDYAGVLTGLTEASMKSSDLLAYLNTVDSMKRKYGHQIKINCGFEVDYLPQFKNWYREFLNRYQDYIDECILSVHFLEGTDDKFWCVDDTKEDFKRGLLDSASDPQALYKRYLKRVKEAVLADLGPNTPVRIGHLTLIKKFQDYFDLPIEFDYENRRIINEILNIIKKQNRQLDFNSAGLFKEYCNETYPDLGTVKKASQLGISLVYSSDAHSVKEVGHAYHLINNLIF